MMSRFGISALILGCVLATASCGSTQDLAPIEGTATCDNLDESTCLFPFPSDHFRKPGGPYGHVAQLDFGDHLPVNQSTDAMMDRKAFLDHDGYPIFPQIAFHLEGASLEGAASLSSIASSVLPTSKTLVVDTETLELAPHWAELDYLAEDAGAKVVELRLARELRHGRRYVVLVRGLAGGAASRGFRALRDGTASPVAGVDERRERFDREVFPIAEKLGIPRRSCSSPGTSPPPAKTTVRFACAPCATSSIAWSAKTARNTASTRS